MIPIDFVCAFIRIVLMDQPTTPEQPPQQENPPQTQHTQPQAHETSNDTKTIVTVLLLIFVFPVGLIVMWMWPKWPTWVKWLISIPIVLMILGLVTAGLLISVNPREQVKKAECVRACIESGGTNCEQQCIATPSLKTQ